MLNEKACHTLLAKGRLLFNSCSAENEYACVLGYIDHNLHLGGWRTEVITEFVDWMKQQRDHDTLHAEHATEILQRLEYEYEPTLPNR